MAFGYRYTLETQENGWTLVRFPGIPEALTEGASEAEARANALDCVVHTKDPHTGSATK